MRGEHQLLRLGGYLIGVACRGLPADIRDERYQEWTAELPAILRDPDVRLSSRRAVRMLQYAAGTIRGTAPSPRRLGAMVFSDGWKGPLVSACLTAAAVTGVQVAQDPHNWVNYLMFFLLVPIALAASTLMTLGRRLLGKGWPGRSEMSAGDRVLARRARRAKATAAAALSTDGPPGARFPRRRALLPGYQPDQVDAFVARIEATLSGQAPAGQAVTAADIEAVKFDVTRRGGYAEQVIDEVLDFYIGKLT